IPLALYYVYHRSHLLVLHSFPTRRSSDLDIAAVAPIVVPEMKRKGFDEGHILSVTASCGAMAETVPPSIVLIIIGAVTSTSISRSEEHTSELQSRFDLVCRLLLEKKEQ